MNPRYDAELLKHAQLVKAVPAFDDFPVTNRTIQALELSPLARGRESQTVAPMGRHGARIPTALGNVDTSLAAPAGRSVDTVPMSIRLRDQADFAGGSTTTTLDDPQRLYVDFFADSSS